MDKSLTKSSLNCDSSFSWHNYSIEQTPLWTVIFFSSKLILASNISSCAFNVVKYFWEFLQCEVFWTLSLSLGHSFLSSQPLSSFMWINSSSLNSSGCISRDLNGNSVTFPQLDTYFRTPLIFDSNFISSMITFYFIVALSPLLDNSLFWFPIFVHYYLQKTGNNSTVFCSLWVNNRCTVTNHW